VDPLTVFERQRGSSRIVTTSTHETDAERYSLIAARPEIVPEPGDAHVRHTWPVDVDGASSTPRGTRETGRI